MITITGMRHMDQRHDHAKGGEHELHRLFG
jgi:hypothetical protein